MIWWDMSYNQSDIKSVLINKLETEPEEINNREELWNELDKTNTFIFHLNRCFL